MPLPQAIQKDIEAAEALQQQIYDQPAVAVEGNQPEVVSPSPEQTPPTVVEAPVAVEPAKVVELPPADQTQTADYWKARFDTLQGKYNAEVPRLQSEVRQFSADVEALRRELTAPKKEAPVPAEPAPLVSQKDVDDFGQDLMDAMTRVARAEASRVFAAERAEIDTRLGAVDVKVGQVSNYVAQSDADKFWGKVVGLVPDWNTIDADPSWVAWLDTTPDYSELSYRALAAQAIKNGNPQKIANLVTTWRGGPAPAAPSKPSPQQTELSRQVAPSTVKSGSAPVTEKVYTRAEYEALYDVRNVNKYGVEKAGQMIAEADRAVAEGRVNWA